MSIAILIVMGTFWGLHFALIKLFSFFGSMDILFFPMLLVISISFLVALILNGNKLRDLRKHYIFFFIAGFLGYLVPLCLELFISRNIPVDTMAVIITSTPVFAIIINLLTKIEKVNSLHVVSMSLGVIGICPIILESLNTASLRSMSTYLVAFFIPLSYAVYNIFLKKKWPASLSPAQVAFGESAIVTLLSTPMFFISMYRGSAHLLVHHLGIFSSLIVVTAIEIIAFFELIKRTNAIFVSFATLIALISSYFWGALFFSEPITISLIVGTVFIILSVSTLKFLEQPPKGHRSNA